MLKHAVQMNINLFIDTIHTARTARLVLTQGDYDVTVLSSQKSINTKVFPHPHSISNASLNR